jgi:hypothetical protein
MPLSPIRCSTKRMSQSWSSVSKNARISASKMKFTFLLLIPTTSDWFASIAMTEPHRPVFTLVQSRLMMRWVAGSRAVTT